MKSIDLKIHPILCTLHEMILCKFNKTLTRTVQILINGGEVGEVKLFFDKHSPQQLKIKVNCNVLVISVH